MRSAAGIATTSADAGLRIGLSVELGLGN